MAFLLKAKKEDLVQLAIELGVEVEPGFKKLDLKTVILAAENFEQETVEILLQTLVEDRVTREEKEERERLAKEEKEERERLAKEGKEERENLARVELEKLKLKLEQEERIAIEKLRLQNQAGNGIPRDSDEQDSNGQIERTRSFEEIIRIIRLLTARVPSKAEGWDYFFSSLEKAFSSEQVTEDETKAKVLLCLLGEKAAHLLNYIEEDKYGDYGEIKQAVLREYQPSPQKCLENFKRAKRNPEENFVQFSTRLSTMWEYYCKLREVQDLKTLKDLIVADRLLETLDSETAVHIGVRQGDGWFKPKELGRECDIFYGAKKKTYKSARENEKAENESAGKVFEKRNFQNGTSLGKHRPENSKRPMQNLNCFNCGSKTHFKRDCPKLGEGKNRDKEKGKRIFNINKTTKDGEDSDEGAVIARVDKLTEPETPKKKLDKKLCKLERISVSVNGKIGSALIDSGSEITVIRENLVKEISLENAPSIYLKGIFGPAVKCALANIPLALVSDRMTNVVHEQIVCAIAPHLSEEILIPPEIVKKLEGQCFQSKIPLSEMKEEPQRHTQNSFKAQWKGSDKPNVSPLTSGTKEENAFSGALSDDDRWAFRKEQIECPELQNNWTNLRVGKGNFYEVDGFLFHHDKVIGERVAQLVVPLTKRAEVLQMAHQSAFGGHLGQKKTLERIRYSFYWANWII